MQIGVVLLINWKFASSNQKHYPDLESDVSLLWNFCTGSWISFLRGSLHAKTCTGEFHTAMTSWFCIMFTWLSHFISCLYEGTLHVDKIHMPFRLANTTHVLPVPVYWQTDFTPAESSFRLYMLPLQHCILEWNPRSGRTGVNSPRCDLHRLTFCGGIM